MRVGRALAGALAAASLAACALVPSEPPATPVARVAGPNFGREPFRLEGRVGVRYGEESLAGRIAWSHSPARDELSLASPLGNQLVVIVRDADGVALTDANGERSWAKDAETLTERALGWRLPLAGLADWARGRAAPGPAQGQRDASGRWATLTQSGWRIDYTWASAEATLPRRTFLERLDAVRPLEIRLVVDRWDD